MANPVPTRPVLRALARLCEGDGYFISRCGVNAQNHLRCRTHHLDCARATRLISPAGRQIRTKTTLIDAPEPQTFANDPSRYDPQQRGGPEPGAQGTGDPQSEASSPAIPDISNYYTLFPRTLPHGPPQKRSSLPDSSALSARPRNPSAATFYINPRELRNEFLRLQSLHHPDKYEAGSVAHQRAYALSSLLNNAYKTLSNPLLRAQYLLNMLYDIDVTSEDNSAHPSDPGTLMIVMEAQEEVEGAHGDAGRETVDRLMQENQRRIRAAEKKLETAFQEGNVETARDETVRLKYWTSLQHGLREWEPGKEVRLVH